MNGADPLVDLVDQVMEEFTQAYVSGKWAVDLIPALKYLPEWFPGTGWKQTAKAWNKNMTKCTNVPFEYAKSRKGSIDDLSFVSKALTQGDIEKGSLSLQDLNWIKYAAVSLYTGGTPHLQSQYRSPHTDAISRRRHNREHNVLFLPRHGHASRRPS